MHAILMPRAEFRKTVEGSLLNSFVHSLLATRRLLYTGDPAIAALCDTLQSLGSVGAPGAWIDRAEERRD